MTAALVAAGCGRTEPAASTTGGGHPHVHTAKYGGVLVEVGSHEFNLEVLVDPQAGKLTLWTLDAHAEDYVRIPARTLALSGTADGGVERTLEARAVANSATGEVEGNTAQFEASADWLKGAKDVEGSVKSVTLGGKTFTDLRFDWPHGAADGHAH